MLRIDAAVLFAVASAFCFTCADFAARRGLNYAHALVGATITLAGELVFFGAVALFAGIAFPPLGAHYAWVVAGGTANPGLFLIFFMIGISKIGVSRAAPIKGSSPLIGALLAIPLLGEHPAWYHLAGVGAVVAGIALITSGRTEGRWRRIDALWPIAAAVMAGLGAIFWRRGVQGFPSVLAGSAAGVAAAWVVVAAYTAWRMRGREAGDLGRAWPAFALCGAAAGCGILLYAHALQRGEVYRVLPLVQVSPLFTVLLALLFLRRAEMITWRVPAGAALTVAGAVLVTLRLGAG